MTGSGSFSGGSTSSGISTVTIFADSYVSQSGLRSWSLS